MRKNEDWVEKMPVTAGKSLEQVAPLQDLRIRKVITVKELGSKEFWIAANGYAKVNNGIQPYFWRSNKSPRLEVAVKDDNQESSKACVEKLQGAIVAGHELKLIGEGDFSARMKGGQYLGVFNLKNLKVCEQVRDCDGAPDCQP